MTLSQSLTEAAWAAIWISALQPHLVTKSHVDCRGADKEGVGRGTIQQLAYDLKKPFPFPWDCLIKPACSCPSYKGITMWNDPGIILICHNFKTNTVILFFHHNLFCLLALSICSYQTNTCSTGVHNRLSHWTSCHLPTRGTECPSVAVKKEGLVLEKARKCSWL